MTDVSCSRIHVPTFDSVHSQRSRRKSTIPDLYSRGYKSRKTRNRKNTRSSLNSVSAYDSHFYQTLISRVSRIRVSGGSPLPSRCDLVLGLIRHCVWVRFSISMGVNRWEWCRSRAGLFLRLLMGDWHDLSISASSPYPWWQAHSQSP